MNVLYSRKSRKKIFHKSGCPYLKRIKYSDIMRIDIHDAYSDSDFYECKYCGGRKGYARTFKKRTNRYGIERNMNCFWDDETNALYLQTNFGFWKLVWNCEINQFILYHQNSSWWNPKRPIKKQFHTAFHRQGDVPPNKSFDKIVDYIYAHDKAKRIINNNYKRLPHKTKKQKKYYNHAQRKAKKREAQRIDKLFNQISKKE